MKYEFVCKDCENEWTERLSLSEYENRDSFECDCGGDGKRKFSPGSIGICFKGGGWRDKSLKEKRYREARSSEMAKRQKKHHKTPELQPNFKGQPTESWREAKNKAEKEDGVIEETYEPLVQREQSN